MAIDFSEYGIKKIKQIVKQEMRLSGLKEKEQEFITCPHCGTPILLDNKLVVKSKIKVK